MIVIYLVYDGRTDPLLKTVITQNTAAGMAAGEGGKIRSNFAALSNNNYYNQNWRHPRRLNCFIFVIRRFCKSCKKRTAAFFFQESCRTPTVSCLLFI
jgi:hypothetical protein